MEELNEMIRHHYETVLKAIKLDRGHLEHTKNRRLLVQYGDRLKKSLNAKKYYLENYGDILE